MSRSARFRSTAIAALVFVACTPTAPCACPPATSLFRVFGAVLHANGAPASGARIAATATAGADCAALDSENLEVFPSSTDASGEFRTTLRSLHAPGPRCLRLVAHEGKPGASDSVVMPKVIVSFRIDRQVPDSLGVELRLP